MSEIPQPGPPVFHTHDEPFPLPGVGIPDRYLPGDHAADRVRQEVVVALGIMPDCPWPQVLEMIRMLARETTYSDRWAAQLIDARQAGKTEVMRDVKLAMGWQGEWEAVLAELRKRAF